MPVKKVNKKINKPKIDSSSECKITSCSCGTGFCKKIMATLLGILLVYIIVWFGSAIRNNLQEFNYIGQSDKSQRTITIEATGLATAKPDIAMTTMGMVSEAETVAEAQSENDSTMGKLISRLTAFDISEDDIQTTDYSIYPMYDYNEENGRVLTGYEVRQTVKIKIRNLEISNQVLALAGELGINNVSGISFTVDDDEVYRDEARQDALEKIAKKSQILKESLGVKLTEVVSYDEYQSGDNGAPVYKAYAETAYGLGGASSVQSGSQDVMMNVVVTFEIK